MTVHERTTVHLLPDLEAFLAWAEDQPDRPLGEQLERWQEAVVRQQIAAIEALSGGCGY